MSQYVKYTYVCNLTTYQYASQSKLNEMQPAHELAWFPCVMGVFFFISKGTAHDFYLRMISIQYNDGDTHLYFLQNNIATSNFLFQIHSGLRICSKK